MWVKVTGHVLSIKVSLKSIIHITCLNSASVPFHTVTWGKYDPILYILVNKGKIHTQIAHI